MGNKRKAPSRFNMAPGPRGTKRKMVNAAKEPTDNEDHWSSVLNENEGLILSVFQDL